MFSRDYHHPEIGQSWAVRVVDDTLIVFSDAGSSYRPCRDKALTDAQQEIEEKQRSGYVETERSLSRRSLEDRRVGRGKFWIIDLDGDTCNLQYGSIPANTRHGYYGRTDSKVFDTADAARAWYIRQVAAKLAKGYVELHPRTTIYSATATVKRKGK